MIFDAKNQDLSILKKLQEAFKLSRVYSKLQKKEIKKFVWGKYQLYPVCYGMFKQNVSFTGVPAVPFLSSHLFRKNTAKMTVFRPKICCVVTFDLF